MMFGSIPQQDVFQRVMSARCEDTAVRGAVGGGSLYFVFAFIPMFLAYSATLVDPAMVNRLIDSDPQHILPSLILSHTPLFAQVMFFGALLPAILSSRLISRPGWRSEPSFFKPSAKPSKQRASGRGRRWRIFPIGV